MIWRVVQQGIKSLMSVNEMQNSEILAVGSFLCVIEESKTFEWSIRLHKNCMIEG